MIRSEDVDIGVVVGERSFGVGRSGCINSVDSWFRSRGDIGGVLVFVIGSNGKEDVVVD